MMWLPRLVIGVWVACMTFSFVRAELPSIELHSLSRPGGQIGTDFETELIGGQRTDEVERLIFSHPSITATVLKSSPLPFSDVPTIQYGKFQIKIGPDVLPGTYEVRAFGRYGLSNARLFYISDEPWQVLSGDDHRELSKAKPIQRDHVIQDVCPAQARKYYEVNLEADRPTTIQTYAGTVDSRARLVVEVFDPNGHRIRDAIPIDGRETQLSFTPNETGKYTITIFDQVFQGGPEYSYLFSVSNTKIHESAALLQDWKAAVAFLESGRGHTFASRPVSSGLATLRAPIIESPALEHDESLFAERRAMSIPSACVVSASFESNDDQDWFECHFEKGQSLAFEIVSQRLGQLTDPSLAIYGVEGAGTKDEKLRLIAQNDDPPALGAADFRIVNKDPAIVFNAPETSLYRVLVRDQQRVTQRTKIEDRRYVLEVRKPNPDFALIAHIAYPLREPEQARMKSPTIMRGGTLAITVDRVAYDGFSLPIDLTLGGLSPGMGCPHGALAMDQSTTHLILAAAPNAEARMGTLTISGTSKPGDRSLTHSAKLFEFAWGQTDTRRAPIAHFIRQLPFAVDKIDEMPVIVGLHRSVGEESLVQQFVNALQKMPDSYARDQVFEVSRGTSAKIPVVVDRREGGKQPVIARLRNLPAKTSVNEVTIAADKSVGELTWNVAKDALLGDYWVWAQCETTVKFKPNPQALERVQKRLADLQELLKATEEAQARAALEAEIKATNDKLKAQTDASRLQDFATQLPSLPIHLRIVESPEAKK